MEELHSERGSAAPIYSRTVTPELVQEEQNLASRMDFLSHRGHMEPKIKRAIWLLAKVMLASFKLDSFNMSDLNEAKDLMTQEIHDHLGPDDYDCAYEYKKVGYAERCGRTRFDHPLGLEPDGET